MKPLNSNLVAFPAISFKMWRFQLTTLSDTFGKNLPNNSKLKAMQFQ